MIDSSGTVKAQFDYYPYGGERWSSISVDTKHRFTGKYLDDEEVNQYYFGARYLNNVTRRFNSIDPLARRYPAWSPYTYALDNPMRNVDPNGEFVETVADVASLGLSVYDFVEDPSWQPGDTKAKWKRISSAGIDKPEPLSNPRHSFGNRLIALDLIHAIETNTQPHGSMYDGRAALEMILAVYESHRLGKSIPLPLKNRNHPLALL